MRYLLNRLLMLVITMIIVSMLTFAAFALIPGDPATAMLGTEATPERVAALRESMGLNRPLPVRYGEWLLGFFTGDLGTSYSYSRPVWELIAPKIAVTLTLSLLSFIIIVAVSVPAGILSAGQGEKRLRGADVAANQLMMAVPPFFTGILLTWIFSTTLRWFVHGSFPGLGVSFSRSLGYLFYGAVCIAIPRIAMTVRMLTSTVEAEMKRDYVRTSYSRGMSRKAVLFTHVLKNSLTPIVTFLAQTMAEIIAGSIVVEQVFAVPGLGRFLVASISNRDYPVVETIVVILAFWVVLAGTLADVINMLIDPRIRYGGAE